MKKVVLLMVVFCVCGLAYSQTPAKKIDWEFLVNDDTTAIKIAEAVWVAKIGSDRYNEKKPYKAKLYDDSIWEVWGTIHTQKGGSPETLIQRRDGKIIRMMQTK